MGITSWEKFVFSILNIYYHIHTILNSYYDHMKVFNFTLLTVSFLRVVFNIFEIIFYFLDAWC